MSYGGAELGRPQRPTIVTVIGIVAIIFGAMGLLALPINILQMQGRWPGAEFTRPVFQNPPLATWMKASLVVSPVSCILWIVSGIGLLQLRSWARKLAIGLLIFGLVAQVATTVFIVPGVYSSVNWGMFLGGTQQVAMMKTIMVASMAMGTVIGTGIIVTLLILLTRPRVRYAFEPASERTGGQRGTSG